ncbi:hypothetical protein [Paracoccus aerodenitrificans]|uniref:hypothetical protein n=1 Tax=Paracoccus aerodenitrificans TaxID=3017781 RepID=UPI0022F007B3|nr:hypothetical protein [Paracoccus aerodenitrificans]WBU63172.1 hypothetical protein PAE61_12480 [Paracoccus aerodenitrificans]
MFLFLALSTLALVMFSTGLSLRGRDFIRISRMPEAAIPGLALQMLALPAIAFVIGTALLPTEGRAALMLVAMAPATMACHVLVGLAGGHIGLARCITAWSSVLVVPVMLLFWTGGQLAEVWQPLLLVYLLPLLLGLLLAARMSFLAVRIEGRLTMLGSVLTGIVVLVTLVTRTGRDDLVMVPVLVLLAAIAVCAGWLTGRRSGAGRAETLALSLAMQNIALPPGIGLAAGNGPYAVTAAFYGIAMYLAAFSVLIIRARRR